MRLRDAPDSVHVDGLDVEEQDLDLIVERLAWTPAERLAHLLEMLAFEERARLARPIGALRSKGRDESDP